MTIIRENFSKKRYEGEQNKMARRGCRRRLDTAELAEDFISKTFENGDDIEKIATKIVQAEIELAKLTRQIFKFYL